MQVVAPATGAFKAELDGASAELSAASTTAAQAAKDPVWIAHIQVGFGWIAVSEIRRGADSLSESGIKRMSSSAK